MSPQFHLMLQQAIQAFQVGNLDRAESILKKLIQVESKNLPALHILGLVKLSQENYKEGAHFLSRAEKLNPNDASIQYNLAKALSDSGSYQASISHHKKAVALAPNNPDAWLSYGKTTSSLNSPEDALVLYEKALSININYVEAIFNIGVTLNQIKE